MSERQTQNEMILKYLSEPGRTLTVLEAINAPFRCYALSQRAGELRKAGHGIESEWVKLPSGKRIKQYRLEPQ